MFSGGRAYLSFEENRREPPKSDADLRGDLRGGPLQFPIGDGVEMALTARAVVAAKDPGRYPDSDGLVLEVSKSGGKSWALRFMLRG